MSTTRRHCTLVVGVSLPSSTLLSQAEGYASLSLGNHLQSFSKTLRVMDVRAKNRGRPHQKVRFSVAPVMGRNFLTQGRPGVRVRNVRGKSGPKTLCLCCFFFPERGLSLPGSKRPFAPSRNHFQEFPIFDRLSQAAWFATEVIPRHPWKSKRLFGSKPVKVEKKGTQGVRAKYNTVLPPFISIVRSPGRPVILVIDHCGLWKQSRGSLEARTPDFLRSSLDLPESHRNLPEVNPSLREVQHPLMTQIGVSDALWPLYRKLSGIFVIKALEDFAGDLPGGFFWALFPTKMRTNNPATKSVKKSGGSKIKIRKKIRSAKIRP